MLPSLPVVPFLIRILSSSSSELTDVCIRKIRSRIVKNVFISALRTILFHPSKKKILYIRFSFPNFILFNRMSFA
ncbi:hypothetical protein LEP1GSC066_1657 [Leptospira sp. serovar Kenya str. Sh9]|uniref:Uncharacterized protein n=1 Tax=Leptospira borgpetersenii serovar Ballum TaxID=280505 RepID=A0A0S2ISV3_LEPBO|nr:hypothetical protein LBBP_02506 [Leptospira borgpetersenii serovar Ballum]EMK13965.1 hypothetical protein LEP1GSC066_1657 [Leptospira sp. serovar Kenya str. Sh9]